MHPPRLVFWEATTGCNLACRHCRRLEASLALSKLDLTTEQAKHGLIDGLRETGKPVLVCSGGEPLMRPDLFEIAAYAKEQELPIALATNGTLIDEALADRIVAACFQRVSISIDGARAETHDAFRCQDGAFTGAVHAIELLKSRGMSMQVNTTVTQHNMRELTALYEQVIALGVEAWHVFMFVPVGCGLAIPAEQQLLADQYETVLHWLADRAEEQRIFVRATCAPQYFRILAQRKSFLKVQSGARFATLTKGCLAGTGICFISHQGEVFPCGYLPVSSGNVAKQSFKSIWEGSPVFSDLRNPEALEGKCGACEFKRMCSGCRARAYSATGDYLSEEPCCVYHPAH